MAEVEIPEAKSAFEKRVALVIAILAVILSFVDNKGDNAKTDAIVTTNEASNQWAYFQAKGLKGNVAESTATILSLMAAADPVAAKAKQAEMAKESARYEDEKKEIKTKAEALQTTARQSLDINDRCDHGSLLLQIGVILCSISILVDWARIFHAGCVVGALGAAVGLSAFFM